MSGRRRGRPPGAVYPMRQTVRIGHRDRELLRALGRRLGVGLSEIVRRAIRALAAQEGVER